MRSNNRRKWRKTSWTHEDFIALAGLILMLAGMTAEHFSVISPANFNVLHLLIEAVGACVVTIKMCGMYRHANIEASTNRQEQNAKVAAANAWLFGETKVEPK